MDGCRRQGFWQVHPAAADTLVAAVLELLRPAPGEIAWDLYGGAGLFAAAVAGRTEGRRSRVVESSPAGVAVGPRATSPICPASRWSRPRWRSR